MSRRRATHAPPRSLEYTHRRILHARLWRLRDEISTPDDLDRVSADLRRLWGADYVSDLLDDLEREALLRRSRDGKVRLNPPPRSET